MTNKSSREQSGFTLIEIAIVLIIIGLLLGGVLKGQELITSSKVRNAVNDLNGISAAYNGYIDRYRRIPGDDGPAATLAARGAAWTGMAAGNNNGVLAATAPQTFTAAGEGGNFFRHLRAAGFLTGSPVETGVAALPRNAFGGLVGVTNAASTLMGNAVCLSQVPGKAAQQIDTQLDDGRPDNGRVRGYLGASGSNAAPSAAPATAYSEDEVHTVCAEL